MGYFINNLPLTTLEVLIPNADLQALTPASPLGIYTATGLMPGFVIIAAFAQYINATTEYKLDSATSMYLLYDNGIAKEIICSYQDPTGSLKMQPGTAFVFLTGFEPAGPLYCSSNNCKLILLGADGDYLNGDGDLLITMLGKYIYS